MKNTRRSSEGGQNGEERPFVANVSTDARDENLYLYRDDFDQRPKVASFLQSLGRYDFTVPRASDVEKQQVDLVKKPTKARMGTLIGVYLPCVQNIFGVLLFIRLAWIMGTAGWLHGLAIVVLCCACTLLTAISLSAVATNGKVPAGGPYFLISRSLGPEFGGAVGLLFYLGTTAAGGMYIVGAVEIFLTYIANELRVFEDDFNNYRLYGAALLVIVGFIVFVGVRMVNKFAVVSLACVLLSVLAIYVGIAVNFNGKPNLNMCVWNDHLLMQRCYMGANATSGDDVREFCHANNKYLYALACHKEDYIDISSFTTATAAAGATVPLDEKECFINPERVQQSNMININTNGQCYRKLREDLHVKKAIPGIASGVFLENMWPKYAVHDRQLLTYDQENAQNVADEGVDAKEAEEKDETLQFGRVLATSATSFLLFFGIYFPSVTGILAGSNRSGDLADAQISIPLGTLSATMSTSFVYISLALLFAATTDSLFLRDKFGESVGGSLVAAELVPFTPWIIFIGAFLSTVGAGLQSLTGAPRLLQAIAMDDVVPVLGIFTKLSRSGEPTRALLLTLCIAFFVVMIGNVDSITPIVTMFFLMCYAFVNLACALQSLLRNPNWRPRFRYYHWSLSTFGVVLCFAIMFIASWLYAILAICIAIGIYKYIELKGAEKEWGDGIRGLALASARHWLLRLEDGPVHTKNWRPQILVLVKLDNTTLNSTTVQNTTNTLQHGNKMFDFASQLKAGRGLTVVVSVLEGDISKKVLDAETAKHLLRAEMRRLKIKGFADVLVAGDVCDGLKAVIQTCGLGGLRHNTVIAKWPSRKQQQQKGLDNSTDNAPGNESTSHTHHNFIEILRAAYAMKCAVLIPKGIDKFPAKIDRLAGTIDVWWIVHDGGLLMLLPFLLKQTKVWKNCSMRIFTVAQLEDNTIQLKRDLENFVYQLRLEAAAEVVELSYGDISAYTYERTLMMEQRHKLLRDMRLSKDEHSTANVQDILEKNRTFAATVTPHVPTRVNISTDADEYIPAAANISEIDNSSATAEAQEVTGSNKALTASSNNNDDDDEREGGEGALPTERANAIMRRSSEADAAAPEKLPLLLEQQRSIVSTTSNSVSIQDKVDAANVRRMHTAVRLNEVILQRSLRAQLVILNLPAPPKLYQTEENYMEYVEVLTEGLERVLLLRGGGREVITIYS